MHLIHGLPLPELRALADEHGQPDYRAVQLWHWLYARRVRSWDAMTNLPQRWRDRLSGEYSLEPATVRSTQSADRGTRKLLVGLPDGDAVEEVLIPAAGRRTVCVSSQVGCRYRCAFCASGQAGFRRQLEAGEIVGQVLLAGDVYGDPPTHVVFMGIGEPFDNYNAVMTSIRIINDGEGLAIGARRITISTCGVIPGIERLAQEGLQVELSVSLHAPTDALRSSLMPANRVYPLRDLLETCRDYTRQTRRIVTFEYTLVDGINDTPIHARELVQRLAGFPCRVNLIPLSPVEEFGAAASKPAAAELFVRELARARINATLRDSRGVDLKAACGQLRFSRTDPAA
jgi:23S rRNA (adenine2503-C2)-methyltransferase